MIAETLYNMELDRRRRQLGMTIEAVAQRSGVSPATVQRMLSGGAHKATLGNTAKVAEAMGMRLEVASAVDGDQYLRTEARRKAEKIARMVQGTCALEAQGVDLETFNTLVETTMVELLDGSPRRVWGE